MSSITLWFNLSSLAFTENKEILTLSIWRHEKAVNDTFQTSQGPIRIFNFYVSIHCPHPSPSEKNNQLTNFEFKFYSIFCPSGYFILSQNQKKYLFSPSCLHSHNLLDNLWIMDTDTRHGYDTDIVIHTKLKLRTRALCGYRKNYMQNSYITYSYNVSMQ